MVSLRGALTWVKQIMANQDVTLDEAEIRCALGWLVDVPLFIDDTRVAQLYDITIRPVFYEYQRTAIEELSRHLSGETEGISGSVEASMQSSSMLSLIAEGKLGARLEGQHEETEEEEEQARYELTQTPQRQLAQIAIQYYYEDQNQHRGSASRNYHYVENPAQEKDWQSASDPSDPRDLVILELPGIEETEGTDQVPTQLVPTAAEFEDGSIVELYQKLEKRYEKPPRYPERDKRWEDMGEYYKHIEDDHPLSDFDREGKIGDDVEVARNYYWKWFETNFNGKNATRIVEESSKDHGDIRWIDFRLPLNEDGNSLHLHIQARKEYHAGTFAYNLIKRGFKHGLILVGTVKSEPDMDVLAIYER